MNEIEKERDRVREQGSHLSTIYAHMRVQEMIIIYIAFDE